MDEKQMISEIQRLKKEKNAIILAHNYQIPEVQDISDRIGDSLELIQEVENTEADTIIFSGVFFMAESAKILSPHKKILLPVYDAGCARNMMNEDQLIEFKREHPTIPVVCTIHASARVKAESELCCTSANAVKIIGGMEADKILFVSDQNLGDYVGRHLPEKEIISWEGFCITHHRVRPMEVTGARNHHPHALVLVNPGCAPNVVEMADFVGSTSAIVQFIGESENKSFIIGTEMGVLHRLRKQFPHKSFYLLSPGLTCYEMKKTSLVDIYRALLYDQYEIVVEEELRQKAGLCLRRMLDLTQKK